MSVSPEQQAETSLTPQTDAPLKHRIDSETGRLRQVIVHRPGRELSRVTPSTMDALLYDDVPWLEKAQTEHDKFVSILRGQGAEVLYLEQLLATALENPEAREYAMRHTFDRRSYGVGLAAALKDYAADLDAVNLAELLIGGLTKEELVSARGEAPSSLLLAAQEPDHMTFACLPNHLFTRDSSAWIYGGVSVHALNRRARRRETVNMSVIYGWHPEFAGSRRWSKGLDDAPAAIEGGDLVVIGNGAVLVGLSERTTPQGIERLAADLFAAGEAKTVVALNIPKKRAFMHLDTVMTMVDPNRSLFTRALVSWNRWLSRPRPPEMFVSEHMRLRRCGRSSLMLWDARVYVCYVPISQRPRLSVSSGTTVLTSWLWYPAWLSPTTITFSPTTTLSPTAWMF